MTDFASLLQPDRGGPAHAVHLVDKNSFEPWLKQQPAGRRALLAALRFDGKNAYQFAILPGDNADRFDVVTTVKNVSSLSPWCLTKLGEALPEGSYRLAEGNPGIAAFGWIVSQHRFTRYKQPKDVLFIGYDEFPRSASGKILRHELEKRFGPGFPKP